MRETILVDKIVQREIYVSTLLSLLLMKFLILFLKKKNLQNKLEGTLTKVTPPLGSLQLDQPLLDCGLPLIGLDCLDQPYMPSNWRPQPSFPSNHFCVCANSLLYSE